tara:strand:+ start:40506 stop:40619 length:114 start_codon:yes stop_codon:yes gene_type:complete
MWQKSFFYRSNDSKIQRILGVVASTLQKQHVKESQEN